MTPTDYSRFLSGLAGPHWERLSTHRRAGVCVPLFSLRSAESVGIGEIPDLMGLVDWCVAAGLSIIQLLPLNDVGYDFAPYSAKSSFALDPMYLSLRRLAGVDAGRYDGEIRELSRGFPVGPRVNYGIKGAKSAVLWRMFEGRDKPEDPRFARFRKNNAYWLRDDAYYKVLKSRFHGASWEDWDEPFRLRDSAALHRLAETEREALRFHEWLQWQIAEQFAAVRRYAEAKGVRFMGDLPFLVARDSADVWAHPGYFKLNLSSGAPPDLYFAGGQRWGMPPYDWPAMAAHGYDYLAQKLRAAEHFYDLYRIDHVIGVFRVFTIPLDSPTERQGLDGAFDPRDDSSWENHGRRLLEVMLKSTRMVPCGEDLGVVPPCSYRVLADLSIPGLDVMRWSRDWGKTYAFHPVETYRPNSVAVASTHDMTTVAAWWKYEVGTVDDYSFRLKCRSCGLDPDALSPNLFEAAAPHGRLHWRLDVDSEEVLLWRLGLSADRAQEFLDLYRATRWERDAYWRFLGLEGPANPEPTPDFVRRVLEKAGESASIFSIQLLQDWLNAGGWMGADPWTDRINLPGSVGPENWSYLSPLSLEDLGRWNGTAVLRDINQRTGRIL